jgi:putative glutamine amidotransferase
MSRPLVGVGAIVREWGGARRTGVNAAYAEAVASAGAIPFVLSPLVGPECAAEALAGVDALILTGGEDIDPARYGQAPSSRLGAISRDRDAFEIELLAAARRTRLPTLAICRGLQLVNVALGGTLWQDLPSDRPGPVDHDPELGRSHRSHPVRLATGSRAARALGAEAVLVNSFHHQAVRELATGLVATGWAEDGVIEALESDGGEAWLLAVQWHPEELQAAGAPDRGLFAALVDAALSARRDPARSGRPRRAPGRTPGRSVR